MFERQDHWMLGVSSIKSRRSFNEQIHVFVLEFIKINFSFLALPLANAILLVE